MKKPNCWLKILFIRHFSHADSLSNACKEKKASASCTGWLVTFAAWPIDHFENLGDYHRKKEATPTRRISKDKKKGFFHGFNWIENKISYYDFCKTENKRRQGHLHSIKMHWYEYIQNQLWLAAFYTPLRFRKI